MNKRFLSVLVFALMVSASASFLLYRLISSKLTAHAKPATTQVMIAKRDLAVGTLITDADVLIGDWAGILPSQAVVNKQDVLGRGVVGNIYQGEPIIESRLAQKGAGAGLAATIPMGMRAVAVRVNEVVGLAGFVVPGMRVDVLISGNPPGATQNTVGTLSKTLLQNIAVLSAGQKIEKNAEGKPESVGVVNLLVTPDQAEALSLASNQATIQLVLRNPLDNQATNTPGTATANLYSGMVFKPPVATHQPKPRMVAQAKLPPPPPPAAATAPIPIAITVEVIHGSKKTETKFQEKAEKN